MNWLSKEQLLFQFTGFMASLPDMNIDLLHELASYLSVKDLANMAQTTKRFGSHFFPYVYRCITANAFYMLTDVNSLTSSLCNDVLASYVRRISLEPNNSRVDAKTLQAGGLAAT
ncbi:hypothetical protein F5051DRAFT_446181 [Lentinula edodes]|nr:hypothetical protein F5051DRAFT_446181 [Lentinula edodes]